MRRKCKQGWGMFMMDMYFIHDILYYGIMKYYYIHRCTMIHYSNGVKNMKYYDSIKLEIFKIVLEIKCTRLCAVKITLAIKREKKFPWSIIQIKIVIENTSKISFSITFKVKLVFRDKYLTLCLIKRKFFFS